MDILFIQELKIPKKMMMEDDDDDDNKFHANMSSWGRWGNFADISEGKWWHDEEMAL